MRFAIKLVIKQARRLLSVRDLSVKDLRMSEGNLLLALRDPTLTDKERMSIIAALNDIRAALKTFGEDPSENMRSATDYKMH